MAAEIFKIGQLEKVAIWVDRNADGSYEVWDGSVTSSGGAAGTEYTEGDVDATITGGVVMWEDAGNTIVATSAVKPLPINGTVSVSGSVGVSQYPSAAAITDNFGNPTTTQIAAMNMVWDGAAWDRATGDTANGLDVDVTRLPALPAGTNNIGDVDVLSVPANMSVNNAQIVGTAIDVNSGNKSAGTQRMVIATDQPNLTTALNVQVTAALPTGANNIGDVDVLTLPAISLAASSNNIGDVDVLTMPNVTLAAGTNTNEVVGDVAEDIGLAGNPVRVGVRAHAGVPAAMSADNDAVTPWADLSGAQVSIPQPRQTRIAPSATTISTSGYVAGDQIGSALTFTNSALASGRAGQVVQATLTSRTSTAKNDVWLHIFEASPTLAGSDNAAFDLTDANLESARWLGAVKFLATDYFDTAAGCMCLGTLNGGPVSLMFETSGSANLFGVMEMGTTIGAQYGGTTDIVVAIWVQKF